jgi:hypothetical protein
VGLTHVLQASELNSTLPKLGGLRGVRLDRDRETDPNGIV